MNLLDAIILGIIEGLTEFLPISSTGHLILASKLLGLEQTDVHKTFEVAIQLGAILAVVVLFRNKIFNDIELWKKLLVAFIPTGILGLVFHKQVEALFNPVVVATMLIIGGIVFIILEYFYKAKEHHIGSTDKISYKQAFIIGIAQSFAMVPGTSRSGATIIGGLLVGLQRKTAAEFSFLLAVPTMIAATAFTVVKHHDSFNFSNWEFLITGFVTAFIVALITMKGFMAFISKFNFIPFGIYRIIIGVVFLYYLHGVIIG